MKNIPSKNEQVEALIHSKAVALSEKYFPDDPGYAATFTVTRKDILKYLKEHYTLESLGLLIENPDQVAKPGRLIGSGKDEIRDGLNVVKTGDQYEYFYCLLERNIRTPRKPIQDEDAIYEKFVDGIIRSSGTGLSFKDPQ